MKNIVHVHNPSQAVFESLQREYPDTLICPCSTISIKYEEFIQLQSKLHQVFDSKIDVYELIRY